MRRGGRGERGRGGRGERGREGREGRRGGGEGGESEEGRKSRVRRGGRGRVEGGMWMEARENVFLLSDHSVTVIRSRSLAPGVYRVPPQGVVPHRRPHLLESHDLNERRVVWSL